MKSDVVNACDPNLHLGGWGGRIKSLGWPGQYRKKKEREGGKEEIEYINNYFDIFIGHILNLSTTSKFNIQSQPRF
jgi:hypothetical protein